ncbi:hypothetical protein D9M71_71480 [compost metagenome]
MAEDRQKNVPRAIDLLGISGRGLRQGFVDGFVEADHVLEVGQVRRLQAVDPQADDTGAQVTELTGHLHQIKTHGMAQFAVAGTGLVEAGGFLRSFAARLGRLFGRCLGFAHVPRRGQQDRPGMVAQGSAVHGFGGRGDGYGELLPLIDDAINM